MLLVLIKEKECICFLFVYNLFLKKIMIKKIILILNLMQFSKEDILL